MLKDTKQLGYQFELIRTQDFVIFGQPLTNSESLYSLKLAIYNLGNSELEKFKLDFTPAYGWEIIKQDPDRDCLLPQGGEPTNQIIGLNCNDQSLFQVQIKATYILDSEQIIEEGVITKLPPPILYAERFRTWASRTDFESIINKASKNSTVYQKLNPNFEKILENPIDIKTLINFLLLENQISQENKSHRECVLYFIITAITNTQCEEIEIPKLIRIIDNLTSLFEFSRYHCYLFTLISTLEIEKEKQQNQNEEEKQQDQKKREFKLFPQTYKIPIDPEEPHQETPKTHQEIKLSEEIFSNIIRDKDLIPPDSQVNEKKNEIIYYLMNLLVKLGYYKHAYRFYNGFIDENVKEIETQTDVIKALTAEASLVTAFKFLRKSNFNLKEKLQAMIEMVLKFNRINEFLHLPFNHDEKIIIHQFLQVLVEVKLLKKDQKIFTIPSFYQDENQQDQEEEEEKQQNLKEEEKHQIQKILDKYHIMLQIINQENKIKINLPFDQNEKEYIDKVLQKYKYSYFGIIYLDL